MKRVRKPSTHHGFFESGSSRQKFHGHVRRAMRLHLDAIHVDWCGARGLLPEQDSMGLHPGCDSCTPGHPVFRCTECYHKFGTTCRRRLPKIEKHQGATIVKTPEVKALLSVDFRRLASGEAAAGHELLEYLERVKLKEWF